MTKTRDLVDSLNTTTQNLEKPAHESHAKMLFDICKQLDDAFMYGFAKATKSIIPTYVNAILGTILSGGIGFYVTASEGYDGFKEVKEAWDNKQIRQRKTIITTGSMIAGLGMAGMGLSVADFISIFGVEIAGASLIPVLFSSCLLAIYGLSLGRHSYTLKQSQHEEELAFTAYQSMLDEADAIDCLITFINELRRQVIVNINFPQKIESRISLDAFLENSAKELTKLQTQYAFALKNSNDLQKIYESKKTARLNFERAVAYSSFEVAAAALIFASTLAGILAITSVATLGILPTALLTAGILLGASTKIFEKIDERKDYRISASIRDWCVSKWHGLFTEKTICKKRENKLPSTHALALPIEPIVQPANPQSLNTSTILSRLADQTQKQKKELMAEKTQTRVISSTENSGAKQPDYVMPVSILSAHRFYSPQRHERKTKKFIEDESNQRTLITSM